jgi:hypothetical protein
VDHARQYVASELVGSEAMLLVGRMQPVGDVDVVRPERNQRRFRIRDERRGDREKTDEPDVDERDDRELAAPEAAPCQPPHASPDLAHFASSRMRGSAAT